MASGSYREKGRLTDTRVIIKTEVTSSLIDTIATENGVQCIGDLLVGFKYIGERMNRLEAEGRQGDFILGTEESHGFLMGNYARDKDAAGAAVWLAELASRLKADGRTLVDYLNGIYAKYGYCHNYLTEIRLLGAKGIGRIKKIMDHLRENEIPAVGDFTVAEKIDRWKGDPQPHLSRTDTSSRNVLVLKLSDLPDTRSIRITVRPSGTEPKFKIYIEVLGRPFDLSAIRRGQRENRRHTGTVSNAPSWPTATTSWGWISPNGDFCFSGSCPWTTRLTYFEIEEQVAGLNGSGRRR
jgi:phosphoglucomutase